MTASQRENSFVLPIEGNLAMLQKFPSQICHDAAEPRSQK
jgi:hypothetical protein